MITAISWTFNQQSQMWVITITRNGQILAWVYRKTEGECRAWAEKNMPIYARGKVPGYS